MCKSKYRHCVGENEKNDTYIGNLSFKGPAQDNVVEMFMVLTIGMLNNLVYSVMINLGQAQTLLEPLDESFRSTLQTAFDTLIQTPS